MHLLSLGRCPTRQNRSQSLRMSRDPPRMMPCRLNPPGSWTRIIADPVPPRKGGFKRKETP